MQDPRDCGWSCLPFAMMDASCVSSPSVLLSSLSYTKGRICI
jgi:hypothetical protein